MWGPFLKFPPLKVAILHLRGGKIFKELLEKRQVNGARRQKTSKKEMTERQEERQKQKE